jgi:hypothetical protein
MNPPCSTGIRELGGVDARFPQHAFHTIRSTGDGGDERNITLGLILR